MFNLNKLTCLFHWKIKSNHTPSFTNFFTSYFFLFLFFSRYLLCSPPPNNLHRVRVFFSFLISSICKRFTYISFFPPFSASQKKTKKGRKNGTILLLLNCVTFSASSSLFITICPNQFVCLFQLLHVYQKRFSIRKS